MKKIFALLVGINKYPNPLYRLDGCLNDLEEMKHYLITFCKSQAMQLESRILKDEQATRANIIESFNHFGRAKEGDQCLFFFAGHGSRCKASAAFWHLEPDQLNETLVCYDSRTVGGRDLIDKELSYMIWKMTTQKKINFLVITDCCHSGSNMRNEPMKERRMRKINVTIPVEEYYGFKYYEKTEDNQYTPPRGRYVQLAASQAHETAKELKVGGKQRGVFSYLLLDTLKSLRAPVSYNELINRVRFRVRNFIEDQYPILEMTNSEDGAQFFLSGLLSTQLSPYLISYDNKKGWIVNAGAFNGLKTGKKNSSEFQLLLDKRKIMTQSIFADHSTVTGMAGCKEREIYPAEMIRSSVQSLPVAFASESEIIGQRVIERQFEQTPSPYITISKNIEEVRYLIHATGDSYFLTSRYDERPLFRTIEEYPTEAASSFQFNVEQVAKWVLLQEFSHSSSVIPTDAIKVELHKGEEVGNLQDAAPAKLVDWYAPGLFSHIQSDGKTGSPSFKLRLENTSNRPLYCSVLYLGIDFSIDNVLMPLQRLEPGAASWCTYLRGGFTNRNIPIKLHDTYHKWGLTKATNYLKLIISTSEFDTGRFNQSGVTLESYRNKERTLDFEEDTSMQDWAAKTIPLNLYRPLEPKKLEALRPVALFGHKIQGPEGFSTSIQLETLEMACDDLLKFPDMSLPSGQNLQPVELGPLQSRPGLSVLILEGCRGIININEKNPLNISFRQNMTNKDRLGVYGLDSNHHFFYELRSRWEKEMLYIEQLSIGQNCFDKMTIKLFFFKLN